MGDIAKGLVLVLGAAFAFVLFVFGMNELGFRIFEHYNPKVESVRRQTYEQSRAFQEGTIRDLQNLAMEYTKGNDDQKAAIRVTALHRFADVPNEILTPDLRRFRATLENR